MIYGIARAAAIGPIAIGGVILWIFVRRAMVRSLIGKRRDAKAEVPYDPELQDEGFATPKEKERATRRQMKYARDVLDDNAPPNSGG